MFTKVERLISSRNLRPKKKEGFLKIISVFSFLGIMLGVAVLIIVMSVMNGFRTELTSKIIGFNSHITIKPYNYSISDDYYLKLKEKFEKSKVIKTYNGEGVIIINDSAKGVMVKGIDKSQIKKIVFFKENIIDGNFNTINKNEIIIGKYLAIELGVVVGDEINIMSSSFVSTPAGSIPKQSIFKIIGVFSSGMYEFDRNISKGMRLDIPSGTAVRFEPGQTKDVELIKIGGERKIYGFNKKIMGKL